MEKKMGSAGAWMARLASVAAAVALSACGGGGDSGAGPSEGTLRVSLTDAPACYENVFVTVEKVRVHTSGSAPDGDAGWREIVPAGGPVRVDLLNLTNGQIADLGSAKVPAGSYSQVNLVLAGNTSAQPMANAVKPVGGPLVALKTPSGQQSGIKLKGDFEVAANSTSDILLDFDACKSIVVAGNSGQYLLKPVVRLSPKFTGSISGYVTTTMTLPATTVSAQQNGTVVRSTVPDAAGKFTLAYLPAGTYSVVITSDQRATGVIDSVPVGTTTTTVNGTTTAIVLPPSTMAAVSGTVTAGTTPVPDAVVRALQTVSGTRIEVAGMNVEDERGTYTLSLPTAAPVKAPYATTGLTFTADAAAQGAYVLEVLAAGRANQQRNINLATPPVNGTFAY